MEIRKCQLNAALTTMRCYHFGNSYNFRLHCIFAWRKMILCTPYLADFFLHNTHKPEYKVLIKERL